ncbi:hypothetical protein CWB96_00030 [Pseudoalteromonas citrea]|uniref:Uncharacterized protein n=1 Tax=Pseudoalteromonas citrea TaxID=43655 RepID=A0A5S3XX66_9GAMM|nr:hypothetical protein [Pseudoalteromonas citrea]TMP46340.1 hypothetical protein CWB97_02460 [Pseudoalteromonas citrea]TMP63031.1 hypothetical protein CWB96_00030 [Pseudoalteromonas citrea]
MSKIEDLFVVRQGGGRHTLKPQKQYIITRQGAIKELESTDIEFTEQIENPESLLLLGNKGDLRQLETIYRNLSVLFNGSVRKDEMYHITPTAISPLTTPGGSYDAKGMAYINKIRFKATPQSEVTYLVEGSNDDITWHTLANESLTINDSGAVETTSAIGSSKYRYFRATATQGTIHDVVFLVEDIATSKFLPLDQAGRLQELNAETYDTTFFIQGGPHVSRKLLTFISPQVLYIRNNWGGFVGSADIPPHSPYDIALHLNNTPIGTMTINTDGNISMTTINRLALNPGDKLSLISASYADSQLADISLTLVFDRKEKA